MKSQKDQMISLKEISDIIILLKNMIQVLFKNTNSNYTCAVF